MMLLTLRGSTFFMGPCRPRGPLGQGATPWTETAVSVDNAGRLLARCPPFYQSSRQTRGRRILPTQAIPQDNESSKSPSQVIEESSQVREVREARKSGQAQPVKPGKSGQAHRVKARESRGQVKSSRTKSAPSHRFADISQLSSSSQRTAPPQAAGLCRVRLGGAE
jgi:hypothetical protein